MTSELAFTKDGSYFTAPLPFDFLEGHSVKWDADSFGVYEGDGLTGENLCEYRGQLTNSKNDAYDFFVAKSKQLKSMALLNLKMSALEDYATQVDADDHPMQSMIKKDGIIDWVSFRSIHLLHSDVGVRFILNFERHFCFQD